MRFLRTRNFVLKFPPARSLPRTNVFTLAHSAAVAIAAAAPAAAAELSVSCKSKTTYPRDAAARVCAVAREDTARYSEVYANKLKSHRC